MSLVSGTNYTTEIINGARNAVVNGNLNSWSTGSTFTAVDSGDTVADRFKITKLNAAVVDVLRSTDVPTFAETGAHSSYSLHVDITTSDASVDAGDAFGVRHTLSGSDYARLSGSDATLTFWVKGDVTGTHCMSFRNSGSDRSYVTEYTISTTDTWEKKTMTIPLSETGGTWDYTSGEGLIIEWSMMCGTTWQTTADAWQTGLYFATANQVNVMAGLNNFRIAQVQFEKGITATTFDVSSHIALSGDTMTGSLTIESATPSLITKTTGTTGYHAWSLRDSSGYWRMQLGADLTNNKMKLIYTDATNTQKCRLELDNDGLASIYNTTGTTAPTTPTADNNLTPKKYVDDNFLGITATAADSLELNGKTSTSASTVSTIVERNTSGDLFCRLLRQDYATTNASPVYFLAQNAVGNGADNYARPSTKLQVVTALAGSIGTGAVGSYAFLARAISAATFTAGSSYAGSGLRYAAIGGDNSVLDTGTDGNLQISIGATPAGTWKAMGTATAQGSYEHASLFLRIS